MDTISSIIKKSTALLLWIGNYIVSKVLMNQYPRMKNFFTNCFAKKIEEYKYNAVSL